MSLEVRVRKEQLGPNAEQVLLDLSDLLEIPVKTIRGRCRTSSTSTLSRSRWRSS